MEHGRPASRYEELVKAVTEGAQLDLAGMLEWTAARLVKVHHEDPNVDYVLTLLDRAKRLRQALAHLRGE
jgi:hypothetical protein